MGSQSFNNIVLLLRLYPALWRKSWILITTQKFQVMLYVEFKEMKQLTTQHKDMPRWIMMLSFVLISHWDATKLS